MEIRGTNKELLDGINAPVRKWGFSSIYLISFIVGFGVLALIGGLIMGLFVVIFLIVYILIFRILSKRLVAAEKRGVYNPFEMQLDFMNMPKRIELGVDVMEILINREDSDESK